MRSRNHEAALADHAIALERRQLDALLDNKAPPASNPTNVNCIAVNTTIPSETKKGCKKQQLNRSPYERIKGASAPTD